MVRENLTSEQIVKIAEENAKSGTHLAVRRQINKLFRAQDNSHLAPLNGRFNATERAIRRARKFESMSDVMSPLEYAYFLDADISGIVNDESNWW